MIMEDDQYCGSELALQPGDAFGVMPPQPVNVVLPFLTRLGISDPGRYYRMKAAQNTRSLSISIPSNCARDCFMNGKISLSFLDLFTYVLDLYSFPKKSLICAMAQYCKENSADQKYMYYLASREGQDTYRMWMQRSAPLSTTLLDWLTAFPSCKPPITLFIEHLPTIKPRYYSTLLPGGTGCKLEFCLNIQPNGLCSSWIYKQSGGGSLMCFRRPAPQGGMAIRLKCEDPLVSNKLIPVPGCDLEWKEAVPVPARPWIMIATGTGIAPMMSLIRERMRSLLLPVQPIWLFYGCRYRNIDNLFYEELIDFGFRESEYPEGALTLDLACSRDHGDKKEYVQHVLDRKKDLVISWILDRDAVIFICGNRASMVQSVHEWLTQTLAARFGTLNADEDVQAARALLLQWAGCGKYQRETWGG
jgi:methionine synthase reductase